MSKRSHRRKTRSGARILIASMSNPCIVHPNGDIEEFPLSSVWSKEFIKAKQETFSDPKTKIGILLKGPLKRRGQKTRQRLLFVNSADINDIWQVKRHEYTYRVREKASTHRLNIGFIKQLINREMPKLEEYLKS